jgi:NAD(P)-dependent dehydrogenase (short-subunit alcohol dehydrogenase family)
MDMPERADLLVIGGTSGIGRAIAASYADRGSSVIIAGRSAERAEEVAGELGENVRGIAVDISEPDEIAAQLEDVGPVGRLVLTAVGAGENSIASFNPAVAAELATAKLVGWPAVIAALGDRLGDDSSVLMFGGNAMDKPFPGSLGLTSVNGGVAHMVVSLAVEMAPRRVNAIHPGIVVDTPAWAEASDEFLEEVRGGTPTGTLITTADIAAAAQLLLDHGAITGQNLRVDGGSGL